MKILFELSREYNTLPVSEIVACLKAENVVYNVIESNDNVIILDTNVKSDTIEKVANRLSLTFYVDDFLFSCYPSIEEIKKNASDSVIESAGSIAIRCKNRSKNVDSQHVVNALAEIYSKGRKVSLEKPDVEIRGLITDSKLYTGLKIACINRAQFEGRKAHHRPFFSPISMHPKLARTLVNLSSVKNGETLLDPFCGTGGLLIEAGLIGARVIGSDVEKKMIEGCKKSLDFYNIKDCELFCSDIGDIKKYVAMVDAVVTDLPYGKSTTTKGEDINQLYKRAFENIYQVLNEEGRAVVGLSNKDMISLGEKYFSVLEVHKCRVHRSLTRYFAVYEK